MLISDKRCGKCFQSCCLKIQFRCLSGPTAPVGLPALVSFLCLNCWECRFIFVLSGVGHHIYPSDMKHFVCTHLLVGYFRCAEGFYTSYYWGCCGSPLRKLAHPCGQIGARYAARISCHLVSHMWRPRVVGGDSSLRLSRMRKHSRYPAFTFSGVPVAKSNIIGVFPKCQDTEALSQFRGWILQGPHFSCRYVIRSQRAKKNCLILQFTGHLKVPAKTWKNLSKPTISFDFLEVKSSLLGDGVSGPNVHWQYSSKDLSAWIRASLLQHLVDKEHICNKLRIYFFFASRV